EHEEETRPEPVDARGERRRVLGALGLPPAQRADTFGVLRREGPVVVGTGHFLNLLTTRRDEPPDPLGDHRHAGFPPILSHHRLAPVAMMSDCQRKSSSSRYIGLVFKRLASPLWSVPPPELRFPG